MISRQINDDKKKCIKAKKFMYKGGSTRKRIIAITNDLKINKSSIGHDIFYNIIERILKTSRSQGQDVFLRRSTSDRLMLPLRGEAPTWDKKCMVNSIKLIIRVIKYITY
jgi:hypothetical protein